MSLLPPEFNGLLKSLNTNGVEYLVVGGYAVIYHGRRNKRAVGRNKYLADLDYLP